MAITKLLIEYTNQLHDTVLNLWLVLMTIIGKTHSIPQNYLKTSRT